jgi:disulfide oxidoreductase YuzD
MTIEWFSDDKYAYSISMMFAYIQLYKPQKTKLNIDVLTFNLEYTNLNNNIRPIDILNDLKNKKYKDEIQRINNSDIKYPIIVDTNYNIIDGVHRYLKHILQHKKTIQVYIFDKTLLKKFIIGKRDDHFNLKMNDLFELFNKRFT